MGTAYGYLACDLQPEIPGDWSQRDTGPRRTPFYRTIREWPFRQISASANSLGLARCFRRVTRHRRGRRFECAQAIARRLDPAREQDEARVDRFHADAAVRERLVLREGGGHPDFRVCIRHFYDLLGVRRRDWAFQRPGRPSLRTWASGRRNTPAASLGVSDRRIPAEEWSPRALSAPVRVSPSATAKQEEHQDDEQ